MLPHQVFVDRSSLRITLLAAMALAFCVPARSQDVQTDAAKAAANSRTVARIFASWKAQQERTKSFHFVWDTSEVPRGKAVNDGLELAHSQYECWVDGDDRYRFEASTVRQPKANGSVRRKHDWTVFDGKIYSSLSWSEGSNLPARGKLWDFGRRRPGFLNDELRPLLLVFRAFDQRGRRRGDQYRLATKDAIVGGVRCIKLQNSGKPEDRVESLWADPQQGDALVFWEVRAPGAQFPPISLQYRRDQKNGSIPIEWRTGPPDGRLLDLISKVKTFAINERLPADVFKIRFPSSTAVAVDLEGRDQEQYLVKPDGSKEVVFNLDSIHSPRFRKVLEQYTEFTIEPEPLRDAISFLKARYGVPIVIDGPAFRDAKIDPSMEVSEDTPGIRFWEVLGRLSAQCPRPFGIVERDGKLVLTPLLPRKPTAPAKSQPVLTPSAR
jgi:hypothetical protein